MEKVESPLRKGACKKEHPLIMINDQFMTVCLDVREVCNFSTLKSTPQKCSNPLKLRYEKHDIGTNERTGPAPRIVGLWDARMAMIWSQNGANRHHPTLGDQFHLFTAMQNYPYL